MFCFDFNDLPENHPVRQHTERSLKREPALPRNALAPDRNSVFFGRRSRAGRGRHGHASAVQEQTISNGTG
jgi:hypothetical protein